MQTLIGGVVVLAITIAAFWSLLPRGEKLHRFVNTAWEQYIAVALCAGIALSLTMIVSGAIDLSAK